MNPHTHLIRFTTAIGAGYGLLACMAMFAIGGVVPEDRWFGVVGFGLAFGAIAFAVYSGIRHLGRPDRVWLIYSQWRSAWLSRLAIVATGGCVMAVLFAFGWIVLENYTGDWRLFGMATAVLSVFTVYASGMIFSTMRPVLAWSTTMTVPNFLALGLWMGVLWLNFISHLFGGTSPQIGMVLVIAGFLAFYIKRRYWRGFDKFWAPSTPETATGLQAYKKVRLLIPPTAGRNFVQREMVRVSPWVEIAAARRLTFICAYAIPLPLAMLTMESEPWLATTCAGLAALSVIRGVLAERWLLFAEAKHSAALYYGTAEV